jgi:hypothetical protein
MVFNFSKKITQSARVTELELQQFIADEDEAKGIRISYGLKFLKVRSKSHESVELKKVTIIRKNLTDVVVEEDASVLKIETSCFNIQFEKKTYFDFEHSKNPDIDNVTTCYQNAFYKCLRKSSQVNATTHGTDARVRESQGWNWCAFRDMELNE